MSQNYDHCYKLKQPVIVKRIAASVRRRIRHYIILQKAKDISIETIGGAQQINNILFLCYGNIYRSPFAEYYTRTVLNSNASPAITSAGFHDKTGRRTPEPFQMLAAEKSINLSGHRSRLVNKDMLANADLIVIMDRWNWENLYTAYDSYLNKVVWLGAFGNAGIEIVDPYGKSGSEAKKIMERICSACDGLVARFQ